MQRQVIAQLQGHSQPLKAARGFLALTVNMVCDCLQRSCAQVCGLWVDNRAPISKKKSASHVPWADNRAPIMTVALLMVFAFPAHCLQDPVLAIAETNMQRKHVLFFWCLPPQH